VIEIGDSIVFVYGGRSWWYGNKEDIIKTDNPEINDFVYASQFMKNLKNKLKQEGM